MSTFAKDTGERILTIELFVKTTFVDRLPFSLLLGEVIVLSGPRDRKGIDHHSWLLSPLDHLCLNKDLSKNLARASGGSHGVCHGTQVH